ncbi:MAG TPA: class I SAM-dependent methyltransferase [Microscillaceae bacterium]|nr:class I SAM-dependent methyltransferase [Microscillaceae bacterium]
METLGTQGYGHVTQKFIEATSTISFEALHQDFLKFIPDKPARVLDVGAGIGRDAFELWKMGHQVTAVEPLEEFREAGQQLYSSAPIEWIADALPYLSTLDLNALGNRTSYDFILASGVWHHLDAAEQIKALQRVSELMKPQGVFALSLRNGPAGAGTHVFATNVQQTIQNAKLCGLHPILRLENQPSLMKNKKDVHWARLAFQKS